MAAVLPQGARGAVGSGLACLTFRALWQVLLSWALPRRNEGWELMRRLEVKRVGRGSHFNSTRPRHPVLAARPAVDHLLS